MFWAADGVSGDIRKYSIVSVVSSQQSVVGGVCGSWNHEGMEENEEHEGFSFFHRRGAECAEDFWVCKVRVWVLGIARLGCCGMCLASLAPLAFVGCD